MKPISEDAVEPKSLGPFLSESRKLRLSNAIYWDHHRSGWKHVVELMGSRLQAPDGTRLVTAVEDVFYCSGPYYTGPIKEPWVGFIHQMPRHRLNFPDLERLVETDSWKESIEYCQGLWVLTDYQKNFLVGSGVTVPVAKVYYPTPAPSETFSITKFRNSLKKKLLFVGEFLRNFQAFYDLHVPEYRKVLLRNEEIDAHMRKLEVIENESVTSLYRVSNEEYDRLLSESVVFLNLFDAGANTTVVECIASGTPIIINKVGGVGEYLGDDYPLYYDDLEEATRKAADFDLIHAAADYLRDYPLKEKLTDSFFLRALQNTAVYRSLPVPPSQQRQFKAHDLSIVICSYKRTYNLEKLLTLFTEQDFGGSFEVLIWNNNTEALDDVNDICLKFKGRLALKVIHSSENFYCVIRMAVASLIRSDLLLICDDDVLPQPNYVSTFMRKYQEYGPEAVICARGHIFKPHPLNEESPERVWEEQESMQFFDEGEPDRTVHFMHADNCLIPRRIMKRALQYEMDRYEFALVDDYWLSYILSAKLNMEVRKIKADGLFEFTECAEDPDIAMYHNSVVNEQRVNFYVYHMRRGWPHAADARSSGSSASGQRPANGEAGEDEGRFNCEELATGIFNREIAIYPFTREGFFLRFASFMTDHRFFFRNEKASEREVMLKEVEELIQRHKSLSHCDEDISYYLESTYLHLSSLASEPPVEKSAWKDVRLSEHSLSIPSTLCHETKQYYKWLGEHLRGGGQVVELGTWLGCATASLAEGLTSNPDFNDRYRMYVYDSYVWAEWMPKYVTSQLPPGSPLQTLKPGDSFLPAYLEFCSPYKHLIEPQSCYVYAEGERDRTLPALSWGGGAIDLLMYDLGHEYHLVNKVWKIFSPSLIPGSTVLVFNPYGNLRSEGLRRFLFEHRGQFTPIHKPSTSTKTFLFTG